MKHHPILLTADQRAFAQDAVEQVCVRGGWEFIQTACRSDHVHVLLSSERDPKAIRRWLKRWLGEAMSARWPLPDGVLLGVLDGHESHATYRRRCTGCLERTVHTAN